jgi:hypothetical protein
MIGAGGINISQSILSAEGIATINYNHQAICNEMNRTGTFSEIYGTAHSCQTAWSWGISRIIDVLEQNPGVIDPTRLGITGCSRNGKAAFGIGAWDQRIALSIPQEAGTGGIASWRIANNPGDCCSGDNDEVPQSLSSCCSEATGWFGPSMCATYKNNPNEMDADSHFMGAMYAPRGLLILENPFIGWLNSIGGHVAAQATAEVYKALGYEKNFYYFSYGANGNHCQYQTNADAMLTNAIRAFLKRTEEPNGGFLIHDEYDPDRQATMYGDLSDWIDWSTPTLQ